jgi:hypothetical protein
MGDVDSLKGARKAAKGVVTRYLNLLEVAVAEQDAVDIDTQLKKAKEAVRKFFTAHDTLVDARESPDDGDDAYLEEVQKTYSKAVGDATVMLKSLKDVPSAPEKKPAASVAYVRDVLPHIELPVFYGDPIQYPLFRRMFDELVHSQDIPDAHKMSRLLQFTRSKANDAIKACALAHRGYHEALDILDNRFGDRYRITSAIVDSLREGRPVKEADELRQLSDDLRACNATLEDLCMLPEVENQTFIARVAQRLPIPVYERWKKQAMKSKREKSRYPPFREFVGFVAMAADDATDPVYGGRPTVKKTDTQGRTSHATQHVPPATQQQPSTSPCTKPKTKCIKCSGWHKLFFCQDFKSMSPSDRKAFVNSHKLCSVCLSPDHSVSQCQSSYTCKQCGGKHSSFIHIDHNAVSNVSSISSIRSFAADAATLPAAVGQQVEQSGAAYSFIPMVKVRVNDSADAVAILDTASDVSFMSKELASKLRLFGNATRKDTQLILNTLHGTHPVQASLVDAQISSFDGTVKLNLNNVFVVDKIPVSFSSHSLEPDSFPHLQGLNVFHSDCQQADLLLGQDNAEVLVPLEVARGGQGQPFAVRSILGWALYGSNRSSPLNASRFSSTSFFSSFLCCDDLDQKLNQLWDIEDCSSFSPHRGPSIEDQNVLKLWEQQCKFTNGHFELPIPWRPGVDFPDNRILALNRLKSLLISLSKRNLLQPYHQQLMTLVQKGHAEVAPDSTSPHTLYLPHHLVLNPKKPGKLRIVFDCAAKFEASH